jgi:hypothetical protein
MTGFSQAAGRLLAQAYLGYCFFGLALPAFFGVDLLVFGVLVYIVLRGIRARFFRFSCEAIYGLVNPVVYLVMLQPGLATYETELWQRLPPIAWILLLLVWAIRLFGAALPGEFASRLQRAALLMALACLALFTVKDVMRPSYTSGPDGPGEALLLLWAVAGIASLYLIPALLLFDYLRQGSSPDRGAPSTFYLLHGSLARRTAAVSMAVLLASAAVASWRPSDRAVRGLVLDHRGQITGAARGYGVDPSIIASIIYVTHHDQISPFRDTTERAAMAAWLEDPTSNFDLGVPLNISVGFAQIKPVTAQTAAVIAMNERPWIVNYKTRREVPALGPEWSLPGERLLAFDPPFTPPADKAEIVRSLLDDAGNIKTCALILALYQMQWEAKAGVNIRGRPDILATLYQIGFERSYPHASPQANAFGRRVQQVYESAWLREAFR